MDTTSHSPETLGLQIAEGLSYGELLLREGGAFRCPDYAVVSSKLHDQGTEGCHKCGFFSGCHFLSKQEMRPPKMASAIQSILQNHKPEATYLLTQDEKRTALLIHP